MKMHNRNLTKWLILVAGLLSSLGLQAQIGTPWTQTGPPAVTFGVDSDGTLFSMGTLNATLTFSTQENSSNPQLLWVPAWGALRVGSFYSAPSTATMGQYSAAFGQGNKASGSYSAAFGSGNTASGSNSMALGSGNGAPGSNTTAFGFFNYASGEESLATGMLTTAMGPYSAAFGIATSAAGSDAASFGSNTGASGANSTAMGQSTSATSEDSLAVGAYNTGTSETGTSAQSLTNWVSTDPLFEIGNGTYSAKSDALVIYKDGNAVFSPPPGTTSCSVKAPVFITTTPGGSGDIPMYTGN